MRNLRQVLIVAVLAGCNIESDPEASAQFKAEVDARMAAEDAVRAVLSRPLDAEFSWTQDKRQTDDGRWIVSGQVTAPNGFGNPITQEYRVVMSEEYEIGRVFLGDECVYASGTPFTEPEPRPIAEASEIDDEQPPQVATDSVDEPKKPQKFSPETDAAISRFAAAQWESKISAAEAKRDSVLEEIWEIENESRIVRGIKQDSKRLERYWVFKSEQAREKYIKQLQDEAQKHRNEIAEIRNAAPVTLKEPKPEWSPPRGL